MGWVFSSGRGGSRKQIYNGELPRKEWLGQFTHLRGGLAKKGREVDTPINTMMMGKREKLLSTKHDLLHFLPLQFCYSLKICEDKLWWSIMVKTWNSTSSKYQSS